VVCICVYAWVSVCGCGWFGVCVWVGGGVCVCGVWGGFGGGGGGGLVVLILLRGGGGGQELELCVLMEVKSLFILLPRLVFVSDEL